MLLVVVSFPAVSGAATTNLSQALFGSSTLFTEPLQPGSWEVPPTAQVIPSFSSIDEPTGSVYPDIGSTVPNNSCLTAGTNPDATPIPGCNLASPVTAGNGALQLTGPTGGPDTSTCGPTAGSGYPTSPCGQYEVGGVFLQSGLPTSEGLDIVFNTYQYNGNGADGIGFTLAATDPTNPQAPTQLGPTGGSLGYSTNDQQGTSGVYVNGLPNGYLGFGLDVFGNYETQGYEGASCANKTSLPTARQPESITVKGPGNGTSGYCLLQTDQLTNGDALDAATSTSRPATPVKVEVVINTGSSAEVPTASGAITWPSAVPAGDYGIAVVPLDSALGASSTVRELVGQLPDLCGDLACNTTTTGIPASWISPTTGIPYQLELGWTASTGSNYETHEVNNFSAITLNGAVPVLQVNNADSLGGQYTPGTTRAVDYTLTPGLAGGQGNEPDNPTLTFKSAVSLTGSTVSAPAGWTCPASPSGTSLTCTYADAPITSSTDPATVTPIGGQITIKNVPILSASGPLTATAQIASSDALGGSATDLLVPTTSELPTTTSVSTTATNPAPAGTSIPYTATITNTSGKGGAPTGTVAFTETVGTTTVGLTGCSAIQIIAASPATSPPSGTATCPSAVYPPGETYTITANYNQPGETTISSTSYYFAPSSGTASEVVSPVATTSDLTSSAPSGTTTNTYVTYTDTVTPADTGYGAPGGTVTFKAGSTTICSTSVLTSTASTTASATCADQEYPDPGNQAITASFTPTPSVSTFASSSAAFTQKVAATPTTTKLAASQNPTAIGQKVTYTATVTPADGNAHPVGAIKFADASGPLSCGSSGAVTASSGAGYTATATCGPLTYSAVGSDTITATYVPSSGSPGDGFLGSASAALDEGITAIATTTKVTSSAPTTVSTGVPVPYEATVDAASSSGSQLQGTVSFSDNGAAIASCQNQAISATATTATADCTGQTYSAAGTHAITATFTPVTGSLYGSSNNNVSPYYETVTAPSSGGSSGGSTGGSGGSSGGGSGGGGGTTIIIEPGPSGPTGPAAPTGPVGPGGTTASTGMTAGSAPDIQTYGQHDAVLLSASGLASFATGTVTFISVSGQRLCVAHVASGSARCATGSPLPAGSYEVLATYGGDARDAPATAETSFVITQMTAQASPTSTTTGSSVVVTTAGLPPGASGTVVFRSGSALLCSATVRGGAATCTVPSGLASGTYPVTASYSGDATTPSETASTTFTLTPAPPVAGPVAGVTPENSPISVALPFSVPATGGNVGVKFLDRPSPKTGRIAMRKGVLTFLPAKGYTGLVRFRYQVVAGKVASAPAWVTLRVLPGSAAGVKIPAAHTGEPWSGWAYWVIAGAGLVTGTGMVTASIRRRPLGGRPPSR